MYTLSDQEKALTRPRWSYLFAKANISGSDIKALQAKACEVPYNAYIFAMNVSGADIQYCQQHACKDPGYAYLFARNVSGADIKYCQEHACKDSKIAYCFARDIPGADKKYCFKHAFPEDEYGPDGWKSEYNKFIMNQACQ